MTKVSIETQVGWLVALLCLQRRKNGYSEIQKSVFGSIIPNTNTKFNGLSTCFPSVVRKRGLTTDASVYSGLVWSDRTQEDTQSSTEYDIAVYSLKKLSTGHSTGGSSVAYVLNRDYYSFSQASHQNNNS